MSRLSDDEKRYFTDQISMLKGENERLTKCVEDLGEEKDALIDGLKKCEPKMKEAQEVMRKHGFVMDDLEDPWQKFAFTLYSYLVEVHCIADVLLTRAE